MTTVEVRCLSTRAKQPFPKALAMESLRDRASRMKFALASALRP
jgi:hypothetical protein